MFGRFGKGRSSAHRLNNVLRSCMAWSLLGSKRLLQFRLVSEEDPSDDPSRDKPLRLPQAPVGVVLGLVCPEKTAAIDLRDIFQQDKKLCLEIFSGVSRLTAAIRRLGLGVGEPWEAFAAKNCILNVLTSY